MKIAIMMRAMDQDSGHRAIIEGFVENMLRTDRENSYLLLYRTDKWLGRFANYENVKELLIRAPHKVLWDQVVVPLRAWREGADIIYNEKFSVPLLTSCPVVMGLHEPAWWAWPQHYQWIDRHYMRLMLPLYVRKAKRLFPISQFVVDENLEYGIRAHHSTVVYPAPKEYFNRIEDASLLEEFRRRHDLPERFLLTVTRVDHVGLDNPKSHFPGKNVETTIRAYIECRDRLPHRLVVVGRSVREYLESIGFTDEDLRGILFAGFIAHEELPKLLNLAELFVIPSFYESYAMALVEAMACGCPVVASQTGACPEITGGAALLADPHDPQDFADKILQVLRDDSLREDLASKSLERASFFDWERSANLLLAEMERVVGESEPEESRPPARP